LTSLATVGSPWTSNSALPELRPGGVVLGLQGGEAGGGGAGGLPLSGGHRMPVSCESSTPTYLVSGVGLPGRDWEAQRLPERSGLVRSDSVSVLGPVMLALVLS